MEVRSCEAGSCDGEGGANGFREEVDTALLKLYAEADHESLLDLLASDNACLLADSAPWLEKHHKWVLQATATAAAMLLTQDYSRLDGLQ